MKQTQLSGFVQKRPPPEGPEEERGPDEKRIKIEAGVTLSAEQSRIVEVALAGHHVFFTGAGGVGKSLTLKALIQKLRAKHGKQRVYVTASTGIAACNIGGTTLHSFAGVGLGEGTLENLVKKVRNRADAKKRWTQAKVLIIDEISMIEPEFFETLDLLARRLRPAGKHQLFGGIQMVLAGDFLQLPYVHDAREQKDQTFLFETKTWKLLFPNTPTTLKGPVRYARDKSAQDQVLTVLDNSRAGHMVHLTQVFRQTDRDFVELLQAVRMGEPSPQHLATLHGRVGAKVDISDGIQPTRLYPHRADVQKENVIELHRLPGEVKVFTATDVGDARHLAALDKSCQAPHDLQLKEGAQVVLLRNLDFLRRLVNGSRGVVTKFVQSVVDPSKEVPVVKFACGHTEMIEPATWDIEVGGKVVCSRKQIPLTLCWASSIHKAMGMTLDKVETKLASVFEYGQLYTSLSRVTSLDGLCLLDFDERKIMAHPRVVEFYRHLN